MEESFFIIDSHLHCGCQQVFWVWEDLKPLLLAAGIKGAGVMPPVEDIYDRSNPAFIDSQEWQASRRRAHRYLLELKDPDIVLYPYFFVWNDFAFEDLSPEFVAVKWHRHANEPAYRYDAPRCREFLKAVKARGIPILLEETFHNTLFFLEKLLPEGVPLIIPHLGGLNGGYQALRQAGVWALPQVYADTALASSWELEDYLGRFGAGRLLFGSDYPFGRPEYELEKVSRLQLPPDQARQVLGDNFRRLCRRNGNRA